MTKQNAKIHQQLPNERIALVNRFRERQQRRCQITTVDSATHRHQPIPEVIAD
ncbi:MAG: hypothetical protein MK161_14430 [Pirellulales bacterium]|nr:hypothetical protein [Pirellulales bacterium]